MMTSVVPQSAVAEEPKSDASAEAAVALPAGMARFQADTFGSLQLADSAVFDDRARRDECAGCGARCKYYCFRCLALPPTLAAHVPQLTLPLQLDVVLHFGEKRSKSTGIHAPILAPDSAVLVPFNKGDAETAMAQLDPSSSVLLFPAPDALPVHEVVARGRSIRRVIAIDSTWQRAGSVLRAVQALGVPCVALDIYRTGFWRTQEMGDHCLATIEGTIFLHFYSFIFLFFIILYYFLFFIFYLLWNLFFW